MGPSRHTTSTDWYNVIKRLDDGLMKPIWPTHHAIPDPVVILEPILMLMLMHLRSCG
jgi:hypothetical protein